MASKINNIEDLHIERMRVKILLKEQEDKLDQHYQYISNKIRPFTGIIDAFGAFSGNGEKGTARSAWMGLVGTILQAGMPIIIQRFFHKKDDRPNTWWGGILSGLSSVIDKDMIRMVVERITGGKTEEPEGEALNEEEGHA